MKVEDDWTPVLARHRSAHRPATADTLDEIRGRQARRTGRLVAGTRIAEMPTRGDVARLVITNDLVYADAVERGANRGARRGPHMAGNHVVADAGPHFLSHMSERLRAGL